MNNYTLQNILRFVFLVLIQVVIFNNIHLFTHINPYIYILFVFLYPLRKEKASFLIFSFLIGLCIDFFSDSGGINAAATLFIAFIRLPLLSKILNKPDFDLQLFNIRSIPSGKAFTYIALMTFIHHFIVYGLEYFHFSEIGTILYKTLKSSILTIVIIYFSIILFIKKR